MEQDTFLHAIFVRLKMFCLALTGVTETNSINVTYPLTISVALGIWLVVKRYQDSQNRAAKFSWPPPDAADVQWTSLILQNANLESHLSDPDLLPPHHVPGRKYITCFDPSSSYYLGTFAADDEYAIGEKIGKAGRAQLSWKQTSFANRRRVVRSLKDWLLGNKDICARVACRDTGKTLIDATFGEIMTTCSKMEWLLNYGETYLIPERRLGSLLLGAKRSEVHYEPRGIVAAIVSWNYPLYNSWSQVLASIFAGNGVILKCSENVVWSTSWFIGAIRECLTVCGFDPELVQLVCCWPNEAKALTQSPFIKHITFVGSEEVGRKVAAAAAVNLTPVTLELGGKDPAIILPGTKVEKCIGILMRGVFQNCGQNCVGLERIIVHSSLYEEVLQTLTERSSKLRLGSVMSSIDGFVAPVDCGSMISSDRFADLERQIVEAVQEGAKLETGGTHWKHPYLEGSYFSPTVLSEMKQGMEIAQREDFAPIISLFKYDDVDDAIELANGTRYGLGASVFGPDQALCLVVAKKLHCGMVAINDFGTYGLNQDLPFGGMKASGYGKFGGPEGLRSLTNVKAVVYDRWPTLIQSGIPSIIDYPIRSLVSSWDFLSALLEVLYNESLWCAMYGLYRLLRILAK